MNQYRDAREQRIQRLEEELHAERERRSVIERQLSARSLVSRLMRALDTADDDVLKPTHALALSVLTVILWCAPAHIEALKVGLGWLTSGLLSIARALFALFCVHWHAIAVGFVQLMAIVAWSFFLSWLID